MDMPSAGSAVNSSLAIPSIAATWGREWLAAVPAPGQHPDEADFVRAASRSRGGRSIIALPSTAAGGTASRIVPTLKPGSGVVTSRADVHTVVTEYGVAELWGRSLPERAEALIRVADPRFREEIRAGLRG